MTTPLLLLRACQIGMSLQDMELVTIGMLNEMYMERANDDLEYPEIANQEDMDRML